METPLSSVENDPICDMGEVGIAERDVLECPVGA